MEYFFSFIIFPGDAFLAARTKVPGVAGEWTSYGCFDLPPLTTHAPATQHGTCPSALKVRILLRFIGNLVCF